MQYPYSVPNYNRFRNLTPASVDTTERRVLVTDAPAATWSFILGAISLLAEINMWSQESVSSLTPEEIVDIFNNEVYMTEICKAVADCIQNSTDVQNELLLWLQGNSANQVVVNQITQYMQNPNETGLTQEADNQDLDYVYGALVSAWDIVLDTWSVLASYIQVAQTLSELALEAKKLLPMPATATLTVLDAFLTGGPAATTAWIQAQAQQNAWVCGVFDSVCGRGQPYVLTSADVDAGFDALTGAPIPLTVTVLKAMTDYVTLINYWKIRSDDDASNDWSTLCSCTPTTVTETVTFDGAGYQSYVIQRGVLDAANGNPLPCASETTVIGGSLVVDVRIDLPAVGKITNVSLDANHLNNIGLTNWFTAVELYDASDNLLTSQLDRPPSSPTNVWVPKSFAFSQNGVAYIRIVMGRSSPAISSGHSRVDNISFTEEI